MGYVYLIHDTDNDTYKIGVTKDLNKRIKSLQTGNSSELKLIESFRTDYPFRLETMLHRNFEQYRELNEWFRIPKDIVYDFKNKCIVFNKIILSLKDNPHFSKNLK